MHLSPVWLIISWEKIIASHCKSKGLRFEADNEMNGNCWENVPCISFVFKFIKV